MGLRTNISEGVWRKQWRRRSVKQTASHAGSRKLRWAGIQSLKMLTVNIHTVCAKGETPDKEAACDVASYIKTLN